mmetsp:Transcript_7002/g.15973  ORF Transcript_7002/g.15973 Transcript_7002/m.15973 type:complete len:293 (-) Transcript_7002:228-1106(-)
MPAAPGRQTFNMAEALCWEQRVEKEELALLDSPRDRKGRSKRHRHRKSKHSSASSGAGSRLSDYSAASSEYKFYDTSRLPEDLRAIDRLGIRHSNLITMRQLNHQEDSLVPKVRMVPNMEDAHWVPGGKLLRNKAEFYLDDLNNPEKPKIVHPWARPPAGQRKKTPPPSIPARSVAGSDAESDVGGSVVGSLRSQSHVGSHCRSHHSHHSHHSHCSRHSHHSHSSHRHHHRHHHRDDDDGQHPNLSRSYSCSDSLPRLPESSRHSLASGWSSASHPSLLAAARVALPAASAE